MTMSTTHHEPRTVQVARVFPVINIAGRVTSAEIAVTPSGLIVVTTPDGGSFAVDPDDQFNQFSAALRAARLEALAAQERHTRTPQHREGAHRRD
jgi:hypothetical protein